MTDKEEHRVNATDGAKHGVVMLLKAATEFAEELPEDKRYDVQIEIVENDN